MNLFEMKPFFLEAKHGIVSSYDLFIGIKTDKINDKYYTSLFEKRIFECFFN